jgi:hypothetical protein
MEHSDRCIMTGWHGKRKTNAERRIKASSNCSRLERFIKQSLTLYPSIFPSTFDHFTVAVFLSWSTEINTSSGGILGTGRRKIRGYFCYFISL